MVAQKARIFLQIKEEEEEEDSRDIYLRRLGGGNAFYIIKEREMGVDKKRNRDICMQSVAEISWWGFSKKSQFFILKGKKVTA